MIGYFITRKKAFLWIVIGYFITRKKALLWIFEFLMCTWYVIRFTPDKGERVSDPEPNEPIDWFGIGYSVQRLAYQAGYSANRRLKPIFIFTVSLSVLPICGFHARNNSPPSWIYGIYIYNYRYIHLHLHNYLSVNGWENFFKTFAFSWTTVSCSFENI